MDAILNFLPYIGWVLLAIMILVFIHELGHYLFAKLFGMKVEKFSVGFPPKIIGKKIGETEYVLGLTPLGGYVKIAGMVDESMDTDNLESEPKPHDFRAKPVWQRMLVMTGGVLFNIILAAIIFITMKVVYGESYPPAVGAVMVSEASVAHDMGLRTGDLITGVNGKPVEALEGLGVMEEVLLANPLIIDLEREGELIRLEGPVDMMTRLSTSGGTFGINFSAALVGVIVEDSPAEAAGLMRGDQIVLVGDSVITYFEDIEPALLATNGSSFLMRFVRSDTVFTSVSGPAVRLPDSLQIVDGTIFEVSMTADRSNDQFVMGIFQMFRFNRYGFGQAIVSGVGETFVNTRLVAASLKRIFVGQDSFRQNIGGPVMIAKATKEAADAGARYFWGIVAMLSITLAIINILPIPALDGGHLVFLIYEGIVRKEPPLKLRMILQQVGMVILLAFMVFVIFNDLLKL